MLLRISFALLCVSIGRCVLCLEDFNYFSLFIFHAASMHCVCLVLLLVVWFCVARCFNLLLLFAFFPGIDPYYEWFTRAHTHSCERSDFVCASVCDALEVLRCVWPKREWRNAVQVELKWSSSKVVNIRESMWWSINNSRTQEPEKEMKQSKRKWNKKKLNKNAKLKKKKTKSEPDSKPIYWERVIR